MKNTIILILKGLIIGTGKIIPGVSGGLLAITLNVYDKGIDAISNFFKNIKKNLLFLLPIGIGIILAILLVSKLIDYTLNHFYLPTMLLFIGLILGGIPSLIKEVKNDQSFKNILVLLIPIIITLSLSIITNCFNNNHYQEINFIIIFLLGIIDAVTMIIPGISGTAILMMLGYYDIIINSFSNFTDINLLYYNLTILIPFLSGLVTGVIGLAKIINFFLNRYRTSSYFAIIGFTISSILILTKIILQNNYSIKEILLSFLLLIIGYFASKKIDTIN